jgi:two-component system chemotaxis response regulator CheB
MEKRAPGQPIRVLVVEDSRAQRELLVGILQANGMAVVGTASDGHTAISSTQRLRPNVIAMDIHMPGLDGYTATRRIMELCPTPIVLISSAGVAEQSTIAALAAGALTVVRKPGGGSTPDDVVERMQFLKIMRLMADVLVVTRRPEPVVFQDVADLALSMPHTAADIHYPRAAAVGAPHPKILAIAASTGGPAAVQTILKSLGPSFPLPVLLAQHIARGFTTALADWLQSTTDMPVKIGQSTELLQPGHVYLAPDDLHLAVFARGYIANRPVHSADRYTPSADILFETVAAAYGSQAIGLILTGMGDDGARGLRTLRAAGARTLAQDAASCVVYGMPRAAVEAGAAERVVQLADLAAVLRTMMPSGR